MRPRLEAVPDLPIDLAPVEQPRPKIDFRHLRKLGSLPDNVFLLRQPEPPEPEVA